MKKTRLFTLSAAFIGILTCSASCTKSEAKAEAQTAPEAIAVEAVSETAVQGEDPVMLPTSDSQLRPGMSVDKLTIIDLNATWCGPCRIFAPAFHQAAAKYAGKVDFYSVDTDRYTQTAQAFNVSAIPTVVFLAPDGKAKTCIGLGDFLTGLDENSNPSQAEIEAALYTNLCKMIDSMLK